MSIVVEHDKRRRQILRKALDVFMEEGYEDATYQKIADRCKITRTTLYLYFRNKQEIFNFSIKQFMAEVEQDILGVKEDTALSAPIKIKKTMFLILSRMEENQLLLSVVLHYLLSGNEGAEKAKTEGSLRDKRMSKSQILVRRRTIRLRHILSAMLIEGNKSGQLKEIDVGATNDLFYSLLEAAIFRLTVLKRKSSAELKKVIELLVDGLRV
ncbi:MAG: TetR/AcrR family transcriptional regulator [Treponema sp.]|nr:TetR/AcrR family transcriptional regulator [Treponema sp.]